MNLQTIEIYQNGTKVATIHRASQEQFDAINLSTLPEGAKPHLITLVQLLDVERDGAKEVLDGKIIKPVFDDISLDLLRHGYYLAIRELREKAILMADNDKDKIAALYKVIADFEDAETLKTPIDLTFIKL